MAKSIATNAAVWLELTEPIKNNLTSISPPIATNDSSVAEGYSIGSLWKDQTSGTFYECVSDTVTAAVWREIGYRPSAFVATLPMLSVVPTVTTPIPFVTTLLSTTASNFTNTLGSITVLTSGTYEILFTANISGSAKRKWYWPVLSINGVIDPISGRTTVDRDSTSILFKRVLSFSKTKVMTANTIITMTHVTDDLAMTVGLDFSIKRIL